MPSARLAVSLTSKTCSATFRTASRLSACFSDGSFRICWTWSVYCWTCSVGGPATAAAAQPSTITTAARAEPLVLGMRPPPPLQVKLTQTLPAPGRSSQEKTCAHVAGMCFARRYEVRNTKQRGGDTIMQSTWYRATIVSAVLLALGVGPALAGDEAKPTGGPDSYKSSEPKTPGSSPAGKNEPAASPKTEAGDFTGRHTMEGEVTKIDQNKGTVSVKRSEEHTSELQSLAYLVCRLLLEKKKQQSE